MKNTLFIILMNLVFISSLFAQTVKFTKIPTTTDEFVKLRNKTAKTAEGGAAMFMLALKMYNDNPQLGEQCLVLSVDKKLLWSGDIYKGYALGKSDMSLIKSQLKKNNRIPNSYIEGATPKNNYKVKLPYVYKFSSNRYSGDRAKGEFKVFVKCYGADSPRPVRLRKNDKGIWKATSWSSVIVGIKAPPVIDDL